MPSGNNNFKMVFWIFFIALFVVILMTGIKMLELKFNKRLFLSRSLSKADPKVQKQIEKTADILSTAISRTRHYIIHHLPGHSLKLVHTIKVKVTENYSVMSEKIRGKSELKKDKPSSDFLKDISEHKNGTQRDRGI